MLTKEDLGPWKDFQLDQLDEPIKDSKVSALMVLCGQVGMTNSILLLCEVTSRFRDANDVDSSDHIQWDAVSKVLLNAASEVHGILESK